MKNRITSLCLLTTLLPVFSFAQYLSGHIEYEYITQSNGKGYEFSVTLITFADSLPPENIEVDMGDGTIVEVAKTSEVLMNENIIETKYEFSHTYMLSGSFTVSFYDADYECNTLNYSNPDCTYIIETSVRISTLGVFNSIQFNDYALKKVSANQQLTLNTNAQINLIDGAEYNDTSVLFHSISGIFTDDDYTIPQGLDIDSLTGEITWDVPSDAEEGLYEVIIRVRKFRQFPSALLTSSYKRVIFEVDNDLPEEMNYTDMDDWNTDDSGNYVDTIYTNTPFDLSFSVEHPDADSIHINSHSQLYAGDNQAVFESETNNNQATMNFSWTPESFRAREEPYLVHFVPHFEYNEYVYHDFIAVILYVVDTTTTSVEEHLVDQLNLYPNPTQTTLNIEFSELTTQTGTIRVFTLTGQQVLSKQIQPTNFVELDVRNLAQGMYLMHIELENGERFVERFVKNE